MLLYSGRPDPQWAVSDDQVERLAGIWTTLTPTATRAAASKLGYRGVELHLDDGESYLADASGVTRSREGSSETRADPGRAFERGIIDTAPPGTIPPGAPGGELG